MIDSLVEDQFTLKAWAFNWQYKTPSTGIIPSINQPLNASVSLSILSQQDKQQVFNQLTPIITTYILEDTSDAFAPAVEFSLSFDSWEAVEEQPSDFSTIIYKPNHTQWIEQLNSYAKSMAAGEEAPCSNLKNVLWAVKQYLYNNSWAQIKPFLEEFYTNVSGNFMGRECRDQIRWLLPHLCSTIAQKNRPLTADEQALFALTGDILIEYNEDQHTVKKGKLFKQLAQQNPADMPEENIEVNPSGEDVFKTLSTPAVALKAVYNEDGREEYFEENLETKGWVSCDILKEEEEEESAYKTAVNFFYDIVNEGFPVRCTFNFKSDSKNYTKIYDFQGQLVMQQSENQFWANAAQYPALHDDIRKYIQLASKKVTHISVEEMEEDDAYHRRPDFYAAAALTLQDPTGRDFYECFAPYLSTTTISPDLGAEGVCFVTDTFFSSYGITDENAANLAKVIETDPFGVPCELFDTYLRGKETNVPAIKKLIEYCKKAGVETEDLEDMLEE
ncbi:MAG: DUF6138 family protein [Oscillospiraceae bacterium]